MPGLRHAWVPYLSPFDPIFRVLASNARWDVDDAVAMASLPSSRTGPDWTGLAPVMDPGPGIAKWQCAVLARLARGSNGIKMHIATAKPSGRGAILGVLRLMSGRAYAFPTASAVRGC